MRKYLFLILCGIRIAAFAGDHESTTARPTEPEGGFDRVLRQCFMGRDWSNQEVSIEGAGKYLTRWYDVPGNVLKLYPPMVTRFETLNHARKSVFSVDTQYKNAYRQMGLLAKYIEWNGEKLPEDNLREFRKGCMALCISSNYLTYEIRPSTKLGSMSKKINDRKGDCTVFAEFTDYLASLAGIESRVVLSTGLWHGYVQFKINGKWYYAEPQSSACSFMDPDL